MESVDLDMGEIFGEEGGDDDDIGAVGTLPDLPEATQDPDGEEDNAEVLQRLKDLSKGAAKKVIRRPQPKLDPTRLTGERGIPILPKVFEKVKFKGKGHEAADLSVMMRYLEHWSHRLFPKMPFDEVIERVEKLGSKKEVQTCVKKMRLDMPILGEDFVGSDRGEDDEDDDKQSRDGDNPRREAGLDDMWDDLLREEDELRASQALATPTPVAPPSTSSEPVAGGSGIPATPVTPAHKLPTDSPGLTLEQMERIERNKQLARERKMKKTGMFSPARTSGTSKPSPLTQSTCETTGASQSSQQIDKNQSESAKPQTGAQSEQSSKSDCTYKPETQSDSETRSTQANDNETMDEEMSAVIERGTSQNITVVERVSEQDAQHPFTEPSDSNQDSAVNSEVETGASQSQNSEVTESMEVEDSEEMSLVIARQDGEHAKALKPTQTSVVNGAVLDSMEEMSEVIEKQDAAVSKVVDAKGDAEEDKENRKQKTAVENHRDLQKKKTFENDDDFNDDLNEDELMDMLDQ